MKSWLGVFIGLVVAWYFIDIHSTIQRHGIFVLATFFIFVISSSRLSPSHGSSSWSDGGGGSFGGDGGGSGGDGGGGGGCGGGDGGG